MKTALIIGLAAVLVFLGRSYALGMVSRSGSPPGLTAGKLKNRPGSPNCVCSDEKDSSDFKIEPLLIPANLKTNLMTIAKAAVLESGGKIGLERENYLAAIFTSRIFGFVDDFEVRIDKAENIVHIRSASRVGHSDFGANSKRADLFKAIFLNKIKKPGELKE